MSTVKQALESGADLPPSWSSYMSVVYGGRKPPSIGSYDPEKLEARAREVTKDNEAAFLYVFGSAGSCSTDRANKKAFERWALVPRQLVDASDRTLQTTLFGVKYNSPLLLAPIGVHGILHKDGEVATAKAAAKAGVPFIMSTASTRTIEACAQANGSDGQRWYQLYWPRNEQVTLSLLDRATNTGYTACLVTLDTMCMGWRPYDLDTAYLPFAHGVGIQVGTSDPAFMRSQNLEIRAEQRVPFPFDPAVCDEKRENGDTHELEMKQLGRNWGREIHSGLFRTWDELAFVRKNWNGPLILKGILSLDDALKAMEVGCDGIVVSNHGKFLTGVDDTKLTFHKVVDR